MRACQGLTSHFVAAGADKGLLATLHKSRFIVCSLVMAKLRVPYLGCIMIASKKSMVGKCLKFLDLPVTFVLHDNDINNIMDKIIFQIDSFEVDSDPFGHDTKLLMALHSNLLV